MKHTSACIAVALGCLASSGVFAETRSFRCKQDLVKLGDGKAAALTKCGQPLVKDSFCKKNEANTNGCETVDEWTYNPGTGQFMTTLRFESGVLTAITYGERVK